MGFASIIKLFSPRNIGYILIFILLLFISHKSYQYGSGWCREQTTKNHDKQLQALEVRLDNYISAIKKEEEAKNKLLFINKKLQAEKEQILKDYVNEGDFENSGCGSIADDYQLLQQLYNQPEFK